MVGWIAHPVVVVMALQYIFCFVLFVDIVMLLCDSLHLTLLNIRTFLSFLLLFRAFFRVTDNCGTSACDTSCPVGQYTDGCSGTNAGVRGRVVEHRLRMTLL